MLCFGYKRRKMIAQTETDFADELFFCFLVLKERERERERERVFSVVRRKN
jgi:hypothetical protein